MEIISVNFREAALIEQEEKTLEGVDLSPDEITEISEALKQLDEKVDEFAHSGRFKGRVPPSKKQLATRAISVILDEAHKLQSAVINQRLSDIAAKVNSLKNSIAIFQSRYGTGYSFIDQANIFLDCVTQILERLQGKKITPEDEGLIYELFDLAAAVHNKQDVKAQLEGLKSRLTSRQVEKIEANGKLDKALLEVGHEIAGVPFDGDIKGWFRGLDQHSVTPSFVYENMPRA
ncbi:MAG TPA: hypothetical protein VLF61_03230 [Rhabdochlamydiaceae bacterium]|nr:hypothetical protein [Rhabdochlamydiaceae bacterium]